MNLELVQENSMPGKLPTRGHRQLRFARKKNFCLTAVFAVLLFSSDGCKKRSFNNQTAEPEIAGGTNAAWSPDHPFTASTVGITAPGIEFPFCTGTLVTPDLVLTAAHCLTEGKYMGKKLQIYFGKGPKGEAVERRDVIAKDVFRKQKTLAYFPNFDMAWIKFKGPAPSYFKPTEIFADESELQNGRTLILAGYGLTSTPNVKKKDEEKKGVIKPTDAQHTSDVLKFVEAKLHQYVNKPFQVAQIQYKAAEEKGPCFGDSGGPAYLKLPNGSLVFVGVLNGRDPRIPGPGVSKCEGGVGVYTFAGAYKAWLAESSGEKIDGSIPRFSVANAWGTLSSRPETFMDWCKRENLPEAQFATIDVVLKGLKVMNCDQAAERLSALSIFEASNAGTIDLAPLATLPALTQIDISNTKVVGLDALQRMPKLKDLALTSAEISSLQFTDASKNLVNLTLSNNFLTDKSLSGLEHLKALEFLDVSWNNIEKLNFIPPLKSMEHLDLTGNLVSDLSPIQGLKSLQYLHAAHNRIQNIKAIGSLQELNIVDVSYNHISDFSAFTSLKKLFDILLMVNAKTPVTCPVSYLKPTDCALIPAKAQPRTRLHRGTAVAKKDTIIKIQPIQSADLTEALTKCHISAGTVLPYKMFNFFYEDNATADHSHVYFTNPLKQCDGPLRSWAFLVNKDFEFKTDSTEQ